MGQMSERRGAWDERRVVRTKLGLQSGTVYDSIGHIKVCKFRERMKRVYEKRVECFVYARRARVETVMVHHKGE